MASNAKLPPPPSANHVITGPPKGVVGGNRKKQKRRAKQAAKASTQTHPPPAVGRRPSDVDYDEDPLGYEDDGYDSYDGNGYDDGYLPPHAGPNGFSMPPPPAPGASSNKKKKVGAHHSHSPYNPALLSNHVPPLPAPPPPPAGAMQRAHADKNVWNTSTQQERQNIKDFWLSLSEDERKSLLRVEKEAVLKKMKQQQKHSCSCTVCGRKRTAIEEELEVLYEGYYEELEQYAHHDQPPVPSAHGLLPDPLQHRMPHPLALAPPPPLPHHKTSRLQEDFGEDEFSDDEEEEDEEEYSDEDYTDEEPEPLRSGVTEFFNFGQNLTVKGILALTPWLEKLQSGLKGNADNLLTVADDLLKNDGRKFIEMMEQLAERRMARENQAEYEAANPSHPGAYPRGDPGYHHEDPLAANDEFDDDDEASYDSQDEYDDDMDEEEPMGGLTEEQRVQEGRRMFQIFAARMFEQRVLNAYKDKVARERQQKLLEELEDEGKLEAEKEAKKQRDAEKKRAKKKQQQAAKAEEKAKRDAEKAAEEAKLREVEEKKLEEQRRKKDEQRKKKEEGKRKQDEERAKKEADKARRLQEEQQRREDAERKAREQRAAEKAKKEEARKKEREEREAREKEVRERKAQEEKEKKEREAKAKADMEAKQREKTAQQAAQPPLQPPQITKRPSQAGMVAVPPVLQKQASSAISSPHPSIATPAIPKAPTPARPRQTSAQGSHASSPKQSQAQPSSVPSKASSPGSVPAAQQQQPQQPAAPQRTILQKAGNQQAGQAQGPPQVMQRTSPPHQQPMQGPQGMPHLQHPPVGFNGMPQPHPGYNQFQGPMMHGNLGQRNPMAPMYPQPHPGAPLGGPNNRFGLPGMNGSINGMLQSPPPGMMQQPRPQPMGFPFEGPGAGQPPPGFGPQQQAQRGTFTPPTQPPVSAAPGGEAPRAGLQTHSRQQSASDKDRFESAANQPIARPAPIQRPSSVKPPSQEPTDVDDLSKHLGSSALIDDADDPVAQNENVRRPSNFPPPQPRDGQPGGMGALGGAFGAPTQGFPGGPTGWNAPAPGLGPFGQAPGLATPGWGAPLPNSGISNTWASNNTAFAANSSFGPLGGPTMPRPAGGSLNRPLTIRVRVCQACKQLTSAKQGEGDGFHPVDTLMRQIESNGPKLDPPPSLREIEDICETEGDSQNGGGELDVRKDDGGALRAVKWAPDATTPDQARGGTLGEIGSPMPQRASPSAGFGAPGMGRAQAGFGSLGAVGSPSGF
ncbi:Stress response protein nst1 [Saxophila tyrrhenica]|uniref:Stress response protein NST1 n=1 Tax=Saxophila tyrrhenica TaxID=1690608 RepID=A0AAV9P9Z4_9PEZI|nr:Stress response protein nst1 [Saxophila tyrrhenica]